MMICRGSFSSPRMSEIRADCYSFRYIGHCKERQPTERDSLRVADHLVFHPNKTIFRRFADTQACNLNHRTVAPWLPAWAALVGITLTVTFDIMFVVVGDSKRGLRCIREHEEAQMTNKLHDLRETAARLAVSPWTVRRLAY
jgi:hypothetical protein